MAGMPRMTISAPRAVMREFIWLCRRRGKSASEVLRDFMQDFVDSRFAEIEARGSAPHELRLFEPEADEVDREWSHDAAAACGPRGGGP